MSILVFAMAWFGSSPFPTRAISYTAVSEEMGSVSTLNLSHGLCQLTARTVVRDLNFEINTLVYLIQ